MKKILVALGAVLIIVSGALVAPQRSAAASSVDQQSTSGAGSVAILNNSRFAQTFRPAMSKLDKVEVELVVPNGSIECRLSIWSSEGWSQIATTNITPVEGWNTCDYTDLDVTVGGRYAIHLYTLNDGPVSQWKYSASNPYANGFAIWQATDKPEWDYNFKTYGYNSDTDTPATDPDVSADQGTTVTGSTSGTTTTSGTTGEAPSANTSTSIDKPTNLKAEYASEVGKTGAKLTWTASKTTDITGYAVFRTETKGKNYAKIGTTDKKTVTYLDTTVSASKTYYYMVRAVQNATQSVNSNEANLTVPADAPPAVPTNLKIVSFDAGSINVSWDKSADASVTGYNINITTNGQLVTQASLPAASLAHTFSSLKSATPYTITLTATNAKGKTSAAASVSQTTAAAPKIPTWRWVLGLGLIAILIAAGTYLIIRNHKKKPKIKTS